MSDSKQQNLDIHSQTTGFNRVDPQPPDDSKKPNEVNNQPPASKLESHPRKIDNTQLQNEAERVQAYLSEQNTQNRSSSAQNQSISLVQEPNLQNNSTNLLSGTNEPRAGAAPPNQASNTTQNTQTALGRLASSLKNRLRVQDKHFGKDDDFVPANNQLSEVQEGGNLSCAPENNKSSQKPGENADLTDQIQEHFRSIKPHQRAENELYLANNLLIPSQECKKKLNGIRQMLSFRSWKENIEGLLLIEELETPQFRIPHFRCLFHPTKELWEVERNDVEQKACINCNDQKCIVLALKCEEKGCTYNLCQNCLNISSDHNNGVLILRKNQNHLDTKQYNYENDKVIEEKEFSKNNGREKPDTNVEGSKVADGAVATVESAGGFCQQRTQAVGADNSKKEFQFTLVSKYCDQNFTTVCQFTEINPAVVTALDKKEQQFAKWRIASTCTQNENICFFKYVKNELKLVKIPFNNLKQQMKNIEDKVNKEPCKLKPSDYPNNQWFTSGNGYALDSSKILIGVDIKPDLQEKLRIGMGLDKPTKYNQLPLFYSKYILVRGLPPTVVKKEAEEDWIFTMKNNLNDQFLFDIEKPEPIKSFVRFGPIIFIDQTDQSQFRVLSCQQVGFDNYVLRRGLFNLTGTNVAYECCELNLTDFNVPIEYCERFDNDKDFKLTGSENLKQLFKSNVFHIDFTFVNTWGWQENRFCISLGGEHVWNFQINRDQVSCNYEKQAQIILPGIMMKNYKKSLNKNSATLKSLNQPQEFGEKGEVQIHFTSNDNEDTDKNKISKCRFIGWNLCNDAADNQILYRMSHSFEKSIQIRKFKVHKVQQEETDQSYVYDKLRVQWIEYPLLFEFQVHSNIINIKNLLQNQPTQQIKLGEFYLLKPISKGLLNVQDKTNKCISRVFFLGYEVSKPKQTCIITIQQDPFKISQTPRISIDSNVFSLQRQSIEQSEVVAITDYEGGFLFMILFQPLQKQLLIKNREGKTQESITNVEEVHVGAKNSIYLKIKGKPNELQKIYYDVCNLVPHFTPIACYSHSKQFQITQIDCFYDTIAEEVKEKLVLISESNKIIECTKSIEDHQFQKIKSRQLKTSNQDLFNSDAKNQILFDRRICLKTNGQTLQLIHCCKELNPTEIKRRELLAYLTVQNGSNDEGSDLQTQSLSLQSINSTNKIINTLDVKGQTLISITAQPDTYHAQALPLRFYFKNEQDQHGAKPIQPHFFEKILISVAKFHLAMNLIGKENENSVSLVFNPITLMQEHFFKNIIQQKLVCSSDPKISKFIFWRQTKINKQVSDLIFILSDQEFRIGSNSKEISFDEQNNNSESKLSNSENWFQVIKPKIPILIIDIIESNDECLTLNSDNELLGFYLDGDKDRHSDKKDQASFYCLNKSFYSRIYTEIQQQAVQPGSKEEIKAINKDSSENQQTKKSDFKQSVLILENDQSSSTSKNSQKRRLVVYSDNESQIKIVDFDQKGPRVFSRTIDLKSMLNEYSTKKGITLSYAKSKTQFFITLENHQILWDISELFETKGEIDDSYYGFEADSFSYFDQFKELQKETYAQDLLEIYKFMPHNLKDIELQFQQKFLSTKSDTKQVIFKPYSLLNLKWIQHMLKVKCHRDSEIDLDTVLAYYSNTNTLQAIFGQKTWLETIKELIIKEDLVKTYEDKDQVKHDNYFIRMMYQVIKQKVQPNQTNSKGKTGQEKTDPIKIFLDKPLNILQIAFYFKYCKQKQQKQNHEDQIDKIFDFLCFIDKNIKKDCFDQYVQLLNLSSEYKTSDIVTDVDFFFQLVKNSNQQIDTFTENCYRTNRMSKQVGSFKWDPSKRLIALGARTSLLSSKELGNLIREYSTDWDLLKNQILNVLDNFCCYKFSKKFNSKDDWDVIQVEVQIYDITWLNKPVNFVKYRDQDSTKYFLKYMAKKGSEKMFANTLVDALLTEQYYSLQLLPNFIVYVLYIVLQVVYFTQVLPSQKFETWHIVCGVFLLLSLLNQLRHEIMQFVEKKSSYFLSFMNMIQLFTICFNFYVIVLGYAYKEAIQQKDSEWLLVLGPSISAFLMFINIFDWLNLFEDTSFVGNYIQQSLFDAKYFLFIFFIVMCAFTNAIYVVNSNQEARLQFTQQEGSQETEYSGFIDEKFESGWINALVNQYLLGLGEFETSELNPESHSNYNVYNEYSKGVANLLWFYFILGTMLTQILLMNTLIAILGETYTKIVEKRQKSAVVQRTQLYVDYLHCIKLDKLVKQQFLYVIKPLEKEDENSQMHESVMKIEEQLRNVDQKTEQQNQITQNKIWEFKTEMNNKIGEIKFEIDEMKQLLHQLISKQSSDVNP